MPSRRGFLVRLFAFGRMRFRFGIPLLRRIGELAGLMDVGDVLRDELNFIKSRRLILPIPCMLPGRRPRSRGARARPRRNWAIIALRSIGSIHRFQPYAFRVVEFEARLSRSASFKDFRRADCCRSLTTSRPYREGVSLAAFSRHGSSVLVTAKSPVSLPGSPTRRNSRRFNICAAIQAI